MEGVSEHGLAAGAGMDEGDDDEAMAAAAAFMESETQGESETQPPTAATDTDPSTAPATATAPATGAGGPGTQDTEGTATATVQGSEGLTGDTQLEDTELVETEPTAPPTTDTAGTSMAVDGDAAGTDGGDGAGGGAGEEDEFAAPRGFVVVDEEAEAEAAAADAARSRKRARRGPPGGSGAASAGLKDGFGGFGDGGDGDDDGDDDGEEEEEDASQFVAVLKQAWLNERNCPEILDFQGDAVWRLKEHLEEQHQGIREHAFDNQTNMFYAHVFQMEISRLTYLLKSYLRCRLTKIEQHVVHILNTQDLRGRLSRQELDFAIKYRRLFEAHMKRSCLDDLPDKFNKIDDESQDKMVPKPDLDRHVFVKITEAVGNIQLDDETTIGLDEGDLVIMRYGPIAPLLREGKVELW